MSDKELSVEIVKSIIEAWPHYHNSNGSTGQPLSMKDIQNLLENTHKVIKHLED